MENIIKGRVLKFGDNIDTDIIYPGGYLKERDPKKMAEYAFEGHEKGFSKKIQPGDIIVAGKNFGCGSSREQAATCLKALGIAAIVAKSFSRIYFRNAINQGIAIITCAEEIEKIENHETIEINFETGKIKAKAGVYGFPPLPGHMLSILKDGGLIEHIKKELSTGK